jgi:hypothetical protein
MPSFFFWGQKHESFDVTMVHMKGPSIARISANLAFMILITQHLFEISSCDTILSLTGPIDGPLVSALLCGLSFFIGEVLAMKTGFYPFESKTTTTTSFSRTKKSRKHQFRWRSTITYTEPSGSLNSSRFSLGVAKAQNS